MRKHGGTPSRRDKCVMPAMIGPPGAARGRFVGGHQSGLAGCKPPPLFKRGASSCASQQQRQREPWGASPPPSAPTYLPTWSLLLALLGWWVVPHQSWLRALWALCPAFPGWGLLLALVGWVVPRQSWRRALRVLFSAIPGWGLLLPLVTAPRNSWRRALWVLFPAIPRWGLLLASVGWVVPGLSWRRALLVLLHVFPGWSLFLALLGWWVVPCHSWLGPGGGVGWLGGPSSILVVVPVGAVPCHFWLQPASHFPGVGGASPFLAERPVGVLPATPGLGLLLVLVGTLGFTVCLCVCCLRPAFPGCQFLWPACAPRPSCLRPGAGLFCRSPGVVSRALRALWGSVRPPGLRHPAAVVAWYLVFLHSASPQSQGC